MNEYNLCPICGGAKRIDWTISFEQCCPVEMRFEPASLAGNRRLCPGHPEPVRIPISLKHDGKLDQQGQYEVSYWQPQSKTARIYIEENSTTMDEPEYVRLTPAQTLSLLAWLKQEEAELQRLAKEQE